MGCGGLMLAAGVAGVVAGFAFAALWLALTLEK
jgi:hypothetical protein